MISLNDLREKEEITTGEALLASYKLSEKYIAVLSNILRIKRETPSEGEDSFFHRREDNTVLLESLQAILFDLEKDLKEIELALTEKNK